VHSLHDGRLCDYAPEPSLASLDAD
jgi:hypothetical protein